MRLESAEEQLEAEIEDRLNTISLERVDRNRLDGLLLILSRQRTAIAELRQDLDEGVARLDAAQEALRQAEMTWTQQLADAAEASLPQEIIELIERVVDEAQAGRQSAGNRLGELVAIEARALELERRLRSTAADAESREQALLADIFRQDAQPIWSALALLSGDGIAADLSTATETLRYGLRDLSNAYGSRLIGHGIGGLLVLVLLLFLRGNPAVTSQIGESATRRVLDHPIAATVLLTLAFTQPLYPTAQPSVVALNTAIFIGAELVVLGAVLQRIGFGRLLLAGAYLIAMTAVYLLPFGTPLHRLAMLFGAFGGVALLIGTWRFTVARMGASRWRPGISFLLLSLSLLLVAAVAANIFGAVTFTAFVVEAVLRSYLAGIGLLTLSIVLRDFIEAILDARPLRPLRSIQRSRAPITSLLKKAINALAVVLWLWAALSAFRLLEPFVGLVQHILAANWTIGQATISLGTIVVFILSVWLAVYVSRVTRFFLDEDVLPRLDLPRGVPATISTSVHYLIIAGALLFGTAAAGLDLTRIAIVVGALSVGIGFGLQNVVNNFISGLILLFERPIQVGDNIQIGQLTGRVTRIGIRASTVRMYDGSEVIVPNGDLISQQVVNYTLSDRDRRLETMVSVAYGTDLEKARAIITDAVNSVSLVSNETAPQVLFLGFGESSLDFRVLYWIDDFDSGLQTASEVGIAINKALEREGIEIPFPQRDVHFRNSVSLDQSGVEPAMQRHSD